MAYLINGLTFAMMLFILSAGLNIVLGFLGVLNFAHGALFILGAYVTYTVTNLVGNYWAALVIAPLATGAFGFVIEFVFLRHLYKRHHVYSILLTFGLILVIYDMIKILWGTSVKTVATPALLKGSFSLFNQVVPVTSIFIIAVGLLTALGLWFVLQKTMFGKILRAISLDREIAGALGFNVALRGTVAFAAGCALAGLAGVLGALKLSIAAGVDAEFLIYSFAIVVIGGVGSFYGTFIASLIVGEMSVLGSIFFPQLSMSLIFVLLVVFLSIYPRGMFGREMEQIHFPIAPYLGETTGLLDKLGLRFLTPVGSAALLVLLFLAPLVALEVLDILIGGDSHLRPLCHKLQSSVRFYRNAFLWPGFHLWGCRLCHIADPYSCHQLLVARLRRKPRRLYEPGGDHRPVQHTPLGNLLWYAHACFLDAGLQYYLQVEQSHRRGRWLVRHSPTCAGFWLHQADPHFAAQ